MRVIQRIGPLVMVLAIGIVFVNIGMPWLPGHQKHKEKETADSIPSKKQPLSSIGGSEATHDHKHKDKEAIIHTDTEGSSSQQESLDDQVSHTVGEAKEPCSCWNSTAPPECCERFLVRYHKMGHELLHMLSLNYNIKGKTEFGGWKEMHPNGDFRAVAAIRSFYDAIISGYLYHKSGRECWTNLYGQKMKVGRMFAGRKSWHEKLTNPAPYPPPKGRNLCQYLIDESEQDGIRVITEVFFARWFDKIKPRWKGSLRQGDEWYGKYNYVCYEDLLDPSMELVAMQKIVDFLWPAGDQTAQKIRDVKFSKGGHSTDHDVDLRNRLRGMVETFDKEHFNETVAWHQQTFRCGGDSR